MVLRPAQRLDTFTIGAAAAVDISADRGRANKADGGDVGIVEQRINRFLVTMDDVKTPIGKTSLFEQPRQHHRRTRIAFGRFEDKGISRGKRHREHPHRHHCRKIERRDPGNHTNRLAH